MATMTIGKWGNASAVRLPKSFCEALGVGIGDSIRMAMENDRRIIIEPAPDEYTLRARMSSWNGNRYRSKELDWGEPVGEELW